MLPAVLVTGGSRGIGAATVRRFAEAGYPVAFSYLHSEESAASLAASSRAEAIRADAGDPKAAEYLISETERRVGPVGILVNNAGVSQSGLLTDFSPDEIRSMFEVNALGSLYLSRAVLPGMVRRKRGCILNVSSIWGLDGASCEVVYSSTKAAIIGMTQALAKEVGPSGIRVNCVAPGVIDTEMNARLNAEDRAALCEETPLGRFGTADEIAETLFWLASDAASFITGQVISPNGGFLC